MGKIYKKERVSYKPCKITNYIYGGRKNGLPS